jgi:bifunctional non-homologous end joining protein LigD
MYPASGFTKGQVIEYYAKIADVMVPHIAGRPITLKRYPNGVDSQFFYEKNCPKHRPEWMQTVEISGGGRPGKGDIIGYCLVEEPAALVWTANMASLEIHPGLAVKDDIESPTLVVFDLDPGPPAGIVECCTVALWLREAFDGLGLQAFPKTSGSKGMQVYVPVNTPTTFEATRDFSLAIAQLMERVHPEMVVTSQNKDLRPKKVLIDWSQNARHKTTIGVYSLRAREAPTASTPLTWDEVEKADPDALRFEAADVLHRVEEHGDLFKPVLELQQELPALG